ncbi:MAG: hypothetical protein V4438_01020 [Patescibacteria group bacterium]
MKEQFTLIKCFVCGKTHKYVDRTDFDNVICVSEERAGRTKQVWFCNRDCFQNLDKLLHGPDGSLCLDAPDSVKKLTVFTCDRCEKTAESDALNPVIGRSPFAGWHTTTRVRLGFDDKEKTEWHACSPKCMSELLYTPTSL